MSKKRTHSHLEYDAQENLTVIENGIKQGIEIMETNRESVNKERESVRVNYKVYMFPLYSDSRDNYIHIIDGIKKYFMNDMNYDYDYKYNGSDTLKITMYTK